MGKGLQGQKQRDKQVVTEVVEAWTEENYGTPCVLEAVLHSKRSRCSKKLVH